MIIKIFSSNPELLSLLNKNPNTDLGLYLTQHRNGNLIGNCVNDNEYHIIFHDTKYSYSRFQDNQIDFKSFCDPNVCLSILTSFFDHLLKEKSKVESKNIPWLGKTYKEVDVFPCRITVPNFWISSGWYKDGQHLLEKYFKEVRVIQKSNDLYQLDIIADTVLEAITLLAIVSFMTTVSNSEFFFSQKEQVMKYAKVLQNIKCPYFVYYLFIKRCIRSPELFDKLKPQFEYHLNNKVSFTQYDTHGDRMRFVADNIDFEKPVIFFGCGEFKHEKFMGKRFMNKVLSYDVEDYSYLHDKVSKRYSFDWRFTSDIRQLSEAPKGSQLILSEVIEHVEDSEHLKHEINCLIDLLDIDKIIITTPNKDFNHNYKIDIRHPDHKFELSYSEFKEYMSFLTEKYNSSFHKIGDIVCEDSVTSGCVVKINEK